MIEVKNLCKTYGNTQALNNVSFSVGKPEIVGFLGPNGAGKTTAMKIITTYLAPSSGKVIINGIDVTEDPLAVRKLIGYLPEKAPLYDDMVVNNYLKFVSDARQITGEKQKERMDWVIKACGLEPVLHKKIHMLSKGYRQRVGLAQALIHDPQILILDEPTSGLDPLQIRGIRQLIKELAKDKTIILSTHILTEISAVSERILVINQGEIVADGKYSVLKKTVIDQNRLVAVSDADSKFKEKIKELKGVKNCSVKSSNKTETVFHIDFEQGKTINKEVSELFNKNNHSLLSLYDDEVSIEDLFIALTEKKISKPETNEKGGEN